MPTRLAALDAYRKGLERDFEALQEVLGDLNAAMIPAGNFLGTVKEMRRKHAQERQRLGIDG
jgi:hypothetical protein